jgi:hypothetical protein
MDRDGSAARVGGLLIIGVVLITWAYVAIVPPPRLPVSSADGSYYNSCCGLVRLLGGAGSTPSGSFKYVIEKDKIGPYILPIDHAVVATPNSIVVLSRKPDMFIRVDKAPAPEWIDIIGPRAVHRFQRRR